jgi:tetratricopeptide (TPR) repeat protein
MSRTLNLIDILLTAARHFFQVGRFTEALDPLAKLTGFRQLPDHVMEEVQALLGEIHLQQEKYKQARRHLTAAIALRPLKAEYFYLMGLAIDEDDFADRRRAAMYYARATELEPSEPTYWADFGSYLFTIGKPKEALKATRRAFTVGIANAEIVGQVAEVLRREDLHEEATSKLRAALFHNHGAQAFRQLWHRHQYQMIYAEQQRKRRLASGLPDHPVLLPFVPAPSQGKYVELGEKTIRIDQAQTLTGPKEPKPLPYRRPPKG